jgi:hypothetical protein
MERSWTVASCLVCAVTKIVFIPGTWYTRPNRLNHYQVDQVYWSSLPLSRRFLSVLRQFLLEHGLKTLRNCHEMFRNAQANGQECSNALEPILQKVAFTLDQQLESKASHVRFLFMTKLWQIQLIWSKFFYIVHLGTKSGFFRVVF